MERQSTEIFEKLTAATIKKGIERLAARRHSNRRRAVSQPSSPFLADGDTSLVGSCCLERTMRGFVAMVVTQLLGAVNDNINFEVAVTLQELNECCPYPDSR